MAHVILSRPALERAINRCKENHPRVSPTGALTYAVSRTAGGIATVHFFRDARNRKCAACDCPAGHRPTALFCYHIAAALTLHCALVRQRQAIISHPATPAPPASPEAARDEAAEFCEEQPAIEMQRETALKNVRAVTHALAQTENTSEIEIADLCAWQRHLSTALNALEGAR